MVELVDTTDLKSVDPKGRAGSSPAPGTKREIAAMQSPVFGFYGNCLIDCEERSPSKVKTEVRFSSFLSSSNVF